MLEQTASSIHKKTSPILKLFILARFGKCSNLLIKWMNENINFVDKHTNPPNIPQVRPIENFWSCLAQKVYEKGWEAQNQTNLIERINSKLKE